MTTQSYLNHTGDLMKVPGLDELDRLRARRAEAWGALCALDSEIRVIEEARSRELQRERDAFLGQAHQERQNLRQV